ncbi:uncharacterized protein LOC117647142 isoform X4 [Thrips palmi]|uniref:5'-nucleotidase n=1 Tax=Thrips palmi TaxID=161013 RepID=A0A6P8Z3G9_THRPL|nr:uncharacterized protein LOC117647142 isoform X4 [Thrips palmi]
MARAVVLLLAVALAAAAAQEPLADGDATTLNIFFVNDLRYHLFPTTSETAADLCQTDITKCFGGLVGLSALRKASKPESDVWVHSGLALGHAGDVKEQGEDYYRLLKHETAVEGLNLLEFGAMSVDADMFRFGKGDVVTSKLNGQSVLTCANCGTDLTETKVEAFRTIKPTGSTCSVVVIGVVNKSKMHKYLPTTTVADEVQSVKDAITKAKTALSKAPALFVVIGEMESSTVDEVVALEDVSVVLSSGTVAKGTTLSSKITGKKVSSTMPAEAALAMNVGKLSLTLDSTCTPTDLKEPTLTSYHATKITDATAQPATIASKALGYINDAKIEVTSAMALSGDAEPCGYISCTIGQMAADGVHALVNAPGQTTTDPTGVIIPAGFFSGVLPAAFDWSALLAIAPDDPFFCRKNITAEQLYNLLDDMLATQASFPQVAGFLLDQHPGEDGNRLINLWAPTTGLAMKALARDATLNVPVAMPCLAMHGNARFDADAAEDTGVALSDGLKLSLRTTAASGAATPAKAVLVLPPQVEPRVRLFIADQSRVGCEDWVGMTVTYTLLVLGAMGMVAYQGYQLWRFRTTLSYIR